MAIHLPRVTVMRQEARRGRVGQWKGKPKLLFSVTQFVWKIQRSMYN